MLPDTQEQSKDITGSDSARGMWKRLRTRKPALTLVTIRALFGIEFVGGHAKHIVALDADAMQHARFGRRGGSLFLFLRRDFRGIHDGGILPRGAYPQLERGGQHPGPCGGHLTEGLMRVEKMANLLIDFSLSIRSTI
jgi:hypothetical protein